MSESSEEKKLQQEIEDRRSELGETVEALVHKVDVPARAAELKDEALDRGAELKNDAIERVADVKDRMVDRAAELKDEAIARGSELKDQIMGHGRELRDPVVERDRGREAGALNAAERIREALSRTPKNRRALVAVTGLAVIVLTVIVRRGRSR